MYLDCEVENLGTYYWDMLIFYEGLQTKSGRKTYMNTYFILKSLKDVKKLFLM